MSKRSIVAASKQAERDVAEFLGGRRLHAGEWGGPGDVDVIAPGLIVQVKQRTGVPAYITEGLQQIGDAIEGRVELQRLGSDDRPIPVVAIRTKPGRGKPAQTFYVLDAVFFHLLRTRPR